MDEQGKGHFKKREEPLQVWRKESRGRPCLQNDGRLVRLVGPDGCELSQEGEDTQFVCVCVRGGKHFRVRDRFPGLGLDQTHSVCVIESLHIIVISSVPNK